jgi:hypothetical protein
VVHCKPVGNGRIALKHLSPHVFREAISNRRLVKLESDQVTFRYRATDTGKLKLCTLPAEEFIRRLLSMCCPKGSSRYVTLASLHPAATSTWLGCANSLS